jgi:hypothetical protein
VLYAFAREHQSAFMLIVNLYQKFIEGESARGREAGVLLGISSACGINISLLAKLMPDLI